MMVVMIVVRAMVVIMLAMGMVPVEVVVGMLPVTAARWLVHIAAISTLQRPGVDQGEPADRYTSARPLRQDGPAALCRQNGGKIRHHARSKVRQGIEQCGDEHVAGDAANGIEVNMTALSHDRRTPEPRMDPPG